MSSAVMGSEVEEKKVFDAEAASSMMEKLRSSFSSGRTRSYEWRVTQLKNILRLCDEREQDIVDALRKDISKPELESIIYEVKSCSSSSVVLDRLFMLCFFKIVFMILNFRWFF